MKWLWKFLTSRNTGIVLLIVVSLILMIGAALPNPSLMYQADADRLKNESPFLFWLGEDFNSMRVGRSYVFGFLGILLILSTGFCSIDRVLKRSRMAKETLSDIPTEGKGMAATLSGDVQASREKVLSILRQSRWKIKSIDSGDAQVISAVKGDLGFWGSIFFHAILITLIGGLVLFYVSGFYATMVFTEGQELRLEKESLSRIERTPLFGMNLPDLLFKFNKFSAAYHDEDTATDYSADFDITDLRAGRTWRQTLKVNKPLRYGGIDFLIIQQGYSPRFILYRDGVPHFDSFVALHYDKENKDSFSILGEDMRITAQFFPDMVRREDGSVYSRSPRPNNPFFGLDIQKGGERAFRGLVKRDGYVTFGGYHLVFQDLRHWVTLNLVRETGIGFFFVCSTIGLIGVLLRVLDPERRITALFEDLEEGHRVTFYSFSRHFEGMLQEYIAEIIHNLKGEKVRV